jgi:hypothetical protein
MPGGRIDPKQILDVADDRRKPDAAAIGRRLACASIRQHIFRIADRSVERPHEFRCKALHGRIADRRQTVRHELRGGEDIAHVVIDLGHRQAEIGKAFTAFQRLLKLSLHGRQFALGNSEFVIAFAREDHGVRVVRTHRELQHTVGHPADRPDGDAVDRHEDETGGYQRDDQRQECDVARIDQHGGAQRFVRQDHFDMVFALADRAVDADIAVATEQKRVECIA